MSRDLRWSFFGTVTGLTSMVIFTLWERLVANKNNKLLYFSCLFLLVVKLVIKMYFDYKWSFVVKFNLLR